MLRLLGLLALSHSTCGAATPAPSGSLAPTPAHHNTVALCASDDELIEAHLGPNATARALRLRLKALGAPAAKLDATRTVLSRDLAAAMRALASIAHGTKLDNVTALRAGLELKGEPFAEADAEAKSAAAETKAPPAPAESDPSQDETLVTAMNDWIAALPTKGREKLVEQLSKAETEEDEWAVLVVSAKKDTTKVRSKQREALLAAAEAKGWLD